METHLPYAAPGHTLNSSHDTIIMLCITVNYVHV